MDGNSQRIHLRATLLLVLGLGHITLPAIAKPPEEPSQNENTGNSPPPAEAITSDSQNSPQEPLERSAAQRFDEYYKDWRAALNTIDPIGHLREKYDLSELYRQASEIYHNRGFQDSMGELPRMANLVLRLVPLKDLRDITNQVLEDPRLREKWGQQVVTEILYRVGESKRLGFPRRKHDDINPPTSGAWNLPSFPKKLGALAFAQPFLWAAVETLANSPSDFGLPRNQLTEFLPKMVPLIPVGVAGAMGANSLLFAKTMNKEGNRFELGVGWEDDALQAARKLAEKINNFQLPKGVTWEDTKKRVKPSLCHSMLSAVLPRTLKSHLILQATVASSAALARYYLQKKAPEVLDTSYFSNQWEKAGLLLKPLDDPENEKRVATQLVKIYVQEMKYRSRNDPDYLGELIHKLSWCFINKKFKLPKRYVVSISNGISKNDWPLFSEELSADPSSETAKNAWFFLEQSLAEAIVETNPTPPQERYKDYRGKDLILDFDTSGLFR